MSSSYKRSSRGTTRNNSRVGGSTSITIRATLVLETVAVNRRTSSNAVDSGDGGREDMATKSFCKYCVSAWRWYEHSVDVISPLTMRTVGKWSVDGLGRWVHKERCGN